MRTGLQCGLWQAPKSRCLDGLGEQRVGLVVAAWLGASLPLTSRCSQAHSSSWGAVGLPAASPAAQGMESVGPTGNGPPVTTTSPGLKPFPGSSCAQLTLRF